MATKGSTRKTPAKKTAKKTASRKRSTNEIKIRLEVTLIVAFSLCLLLFLCNFNIIGPMGRVLSEIMFGIVGLPAYVFPVFLFLLVLYYISHYGDNKLSRKIISLILFFISLCMIFDLIGGMSKTATEYSLKEFYNFYKSSKRGGGLLAGTVSYGLKKLIDTWGTVIVAIIVMIITLIIFTEKSLVNKLKESRDELQKKKEENRILKEEYANELKKERLEAQKKKEERAEKIKDIKPVMLDVGETKHPEKESVNNNVQPVNDFETHISRKQQKEDEKILRMNKKHHGVTDDTLLIKKDDKAKENEDIHEITVNGFDVKNLEFEDDIFVIEEPQVNVNKSEPQVIPAHNVTKSSEINNIDIVKSGNNKHVENDVIQNTISSGNINDKPVDISSQAVKSLGEHYEYKFPPINLLTKNTQKNNGDSEDFIKSTARKLEETLAIYGVNAKVVAISQGPTVTRYELEPELGTKVSKIKNLSDDIKLNLATSDIRIEAPIPGKAAVGIEVPNKEAISVLLRDLIDTQEFKGAGSKLSFAVGKDIAGKVVVYDIDQFPHLLIAGATGSGKSVCINTLILSLIYKAHPNDVKLIMIDPKVVELSVYNGIPHLLIPVVTDPKKASAALNWAVNEMMERYKKFADLNVRDLKGYNKAVEEREKTEGPSEIHKKLPQIVIIVDELADLIMVAKNEVEDAICRLAQLARACGIHLIIATQRPSVDVITGLIKANMPSRLAFSVSSAIDSRTILDMGGAEELLGKGDMLFFPKGLKKPVRLQGAFVSDNDVNKIVDFLKPQSKLFEAYDNNIQAKIESSSSQTTQSGSSGNSDSEYDEFFIDAGKYIINNNKASIGNLQRIFRIGFNRAARIMDKLAEAGVVTPDEGTKARQVLMSMEDFENYIEENNI